VTFNLWGHIFRTIRDLAIEPDQKRVLTQKTSALILPTGTCPIHGIRVAGACHLCKIEIARQRLSISNPIPGNPITQPTTGEQDISLLSTLPLAPRHYTVERRSTPPLVRRAQDTDKVASQTPRPAVPPTITDSDVTEHMLPALKRRILQSTDELSLERMVRSRLFRDVPTATQDTGEQERLTDKVADGGGWLL
jgi:hypothetical protein